MANFKLMPDPVDLREVTFTNILLLGFDVEHHETQYRIPFTRDMFSVPNRKGMEVVLHFLFTKLNNDSAKESFRNCWPIVDKKKEQVFRKICIEWLTKIKKEDGESRLPTIVPSLLLSPTGDRFYQFLFYFSTYVLKQRIGRLPAKYGTQPAWPCLSAANRKYFPQILRSLTINAVNKKSRLIDFMESIGQTKDEWVKFASEQSKEHRKLCKSRRECESELKELRNLHEEIFGKGSLSSKEVLKRTHNLQKITDFWKTISKLFETEKSLQEQLEKVLDSSHDKKSLNGEDINFKIPDILLKECERQLQTGKRYQNLYEGGNVNLLSLVQLWNLSLHLIKEALSQFPLPDMEHDEAYVRAEAHNHANNLNATISLSNSLAQRILPDLKLSIEELKETVNENASILSRTRPLQKKFNLDFLPATPPVQFHVPAHQIDDKMIKSPAYASHNPLVDTPDAVNMLLHRIKKNTSANMDNQDDTPVRGIPKNKLIPSAHKKKSEAFVKDTISTSNVAFKIKEKAHRPPQVPPMSSSTDVLTNSRIPIPRSNVLSKYDQKKKVPAKTPKAMSVARPRQERESKKDGHFEKEVVKSKAQQLLIDQIAQSVLENSQQEISNSDSDENEDSQLHALDDPMEAFSTEAFVSHDKVPRTPAFKKTAHRQGLDENSPIVKEINNSYEGERESPLPDRENITFPPQSQRYQEEIMSTPPEIVDMQALQQRITQIKEGNEKAYSRMLSSSNGVNTETGESYEDFNTPVINEHPSNLNYNPITPLRFSDDDDDDQIPFTPNGNLGDVDFTPIKTPWRKDKGRTESEMDYEMFTGTKASENAERHSEASHEPKDMLMFTPLTDTTNAAKPSKEKSKLDMFLENNKEIFSQKKFKNTITTPLVNGNHLQDMYGQSRLNIIDKSINGHTRQTPSTHTPTNHGQSELDEFTRNNLINLITPFKSPFSTPTASNQLNISAQEVDDFIEEVMTNTSKTPRAFASAHRPTSQAPKTPALLFGVDEPSFGNDYTLMTPGLDAARPFKLDFSDDDDEL